MKASRLIAVPLLAEERKVRAAQSSVLPNGKAFRQRIDRQGHRKLPPLLWLFVVGYSLLVKSNNK